MRIFPLLFLLLPHLTMSWPPEVCNGSRKPAIHLIDEQEIFSGNIARLIEYIDARGYKVTFGEAYRTHEQAIIYSHMGKGIVNSLHCQRLAFDLNIFTAEGNPLVSVEDYRQFGEYWERLNPLNVWGGKWSRRPDADHFEMDREK